MKNDWGRNMLSIQINSGYNLRIGASNNNFENTLPILDSDLVNYIIKDPYVFDFLSLKNEYKEKELEKEMINKIRDVLILFLSKNAQQYCQKLHNKTLKKCIMVLKNFSLTHYE